MVVKSRSLVWCAAVMLVLGFTLASCKSREEKIAGFVAKGEQLLAADDPVRAELEFKNALQIDPKNIPAMLGLARVALSRQEFQRAFATFSQILEMDPSRDEARVELAWLLAMGKQGQQALLEIQQVKQPEKFQPKVDLVKARALLASDRYEEAMDILQKVKDGRQDKEAQMLLAVSAREAGKTDLMQETVANWRSIDPKDPSSYLFMVQYLANQGNREEAAQELDRMTAADPENSEMGLVRAQLLEQLGLTEQARNAYAGLPDTPAMIKARADFWLRQGDAEKARELLQQLVGKSPDDMDAVLKLGQVMMNQGNNDEAMALLDEKLAGDLKKPDRERLLLAKATLQAREGKWDEAKNICQEVLKENQGNMDAHLLFGKILLGTGEAESAEIHLNQAAAARPTDEEAQTLLARSQIQNKKESLAEDTLKRAVEANPGSAPLRLELVTYYLSKKNSAQAFELLRKGLELQPNDVSLLKTLGELQASQKDFGKAGANFAKIIKLKPEDSLGYIEMGRLMVTESRLDEALDWFRQAADKENGWPIAVPALAKIYMARDKPEEAVKAVRSEVAKRPDSPPMHFILGQILLATGDLKGSEEAFEKASELAPNWPDPYRGLADVYMRQGNLKEAVARVEEANRKSPSAILQLQLAALYEQSGRYQDAIRIYDELLDQSERSPEILNNLAYLLAENSTEKPILERAAKLVAEALLQEPDNPAFLDTSAWIHYQQKNFDAAWTAIQNALLKAPENGLHNFHAAMIAYARGDRQQALDYLNKALEQKMDQRSLDEASALKKEWSAGE